MKWVTFISCLFLISFAESKPRKYRDVELHDTLKHYSFLPEPVFKGITLTLVSQYLQEGSEDDVKKVTADIVELFKKCHADSTSDAACVKHLGEVFRDEICHEQDIVTKLKLTDCCAKADPERNECILSHKNETPGFIPPYQKPSVEEGCKAFEDHKEDVICTYIYEVARRAPKVNANFVLLSAKQYEQVLETCCHAENKEACFAEKARAVKKELKKHILEQQVVCSILKKPGVRALKAVKLAQVSQRFPKAPFDIIAKITQEIVHIHEHVCEGDTLEGLTERAELVDYTCAHKDEISSKLGPCCEKPLLERTPCIVALENDDKPADLSPTVVGFIEDPETCKHYNDEPEKYLARFLYEYGRRHPELSSQLLVRATKGFEDFLKKCCVADNSNECLAKAEAELKKHIADSLEVVKTNCDLYENLQDYHFQNLLLVLYTKKAPQLTNDELIHATAELTAVAKDCCHLDDNHRLVCAEGKTDFVLGKICLQHQEHSINHQVCQCCSNSYAFRRECFSAIGTDPQYVPVPFEPEFHEDLCSTDLHEQQTKKQNLLIDLVKHKPDITLVQQQTATVEFNGLLEKCCKAEDQKACLAEEGPKLIQSVKTALGEH